MGAKIEEQISLRFKHVSTNIQAMPSIVETHPNIVAQWHPTKNTIKPEDVTAGSERKVWWLCDNVSCPADLPHSKCKHEWEATISNRCKRGSGCPYCSGRRCCIHNSIAISHPEIAAEWHHEKNGNKKPSDYSYGSHIKPKWLCQITCRFGCKHEWETSIYTRCLNGTKCPYCTGQKICIHNSIVYTHPDIAKQWHPEKNGSKLPSDYSYGSNELIRWLCPNKCPNGCIHEWDASVSNRCRLDSGCPYCSGRLCCEYNSIVKTHPHVAEQWHPRNCNSASNYSNGSNMVASWLCPKICLFGCMHEWDAVISSRCRLGAGCPYCDNQKCCLHTSIIWTHPIIAQEWHPTKNIKNPKTVRYGSDYKAWWKCKYEHEWFARIANRCSHNSGCPTCKHKTARKLFDYIKSLYPDAIAEYKADWCKNPHTNRHLPFDIFIPSLKVIIELDGAQHFRQISNWGTPAYTQLKDVYKMHLANQNSIRVIRLLQEEVYAQSLEWLDDNLKPELSICDHPDVMVISDADVYDSHISLYESNTLEQCLEKLQVFHDADPKACNDSDESEEESEDDTDESEE
jgi:hypothetical protein